jgi:hypothetical protein
VQGSDTATTTGAPAHVASLGLCKDALEKNIAFMTTATLTTQTQCDELQKVYKAKQTAFEKLTDDVKFIDGTTCSREEDDSGGQLSAGNPKTRH